MEQREMHDSSHSGDILDTIAFGSMLVFASVMPSLGSQTAEPDVQGIGERVGVDGERDLIGSDLADTSAPVARGCRDA